MEWAWRPGLCLFVYLLHLIKHLSLTLYRAYLNVEIVSMTTSEKCIHSPGSSEPEHETQVPKIKTMYTLTCDLFPGRSLEWRRNDIGVVRGVSLKQVFRRYTKNDNSSNVTLWGWFSWILVIIQAYPSHQQVPCLSHSQVCQFCKPSYSISP